MNDDDSLRPINIDDEPLDDDLDLDEDLDEDPLIGGKKKKKLESGDESFDDLAEADDSILDEDDFDDIDPEDKWV